MVRLWINVSLLRVLLVPGAGSAFRFAGAAGAGAGSAFRFAGAAAVLVLVQALALDRRFVLRVLLVLVLVLDRRFVLRMLLPCWC